MDGNPLYQEIYEDLRDKIESGVYSENVTLPAERVLCQMYHVSRSTIRAALEMLRENNYIVKAHGNGNFIKPKMFEQNLTKFHSFARSLQSQHITIKNLIVDYELIETDKYLSSIAASQPGLLPERTMWHKLTRLRSAETFPLMIEVDYLPQCRFMYIAPDILRDGSLYEYLKSNYHIDITDASEYLSPRLPTNKERMLLQIPPHIPCMLCERFCSEHDQLIMIHRTVVRGDKFKFKASYFQEELTPPSPLLDT